MEVWKDINGYEGYYQVSNLGNVKSLNRVITMKDGRKKTLKERSIPINKFTNGYLYVKLYKDSKCFHFSIHRLIAIHFLDGYSELKNEINHKDGNKENNSIDNLEWCSRSENVKHAFSTGLRVGIGKIGQENNSSKLTNEQVLEIKSLKGKMTGNKVAKKYSVSHPVIYSIWNNKTWTHIQPNCKCD